MTFWDSILGQQLAKMLLRELPKLTKEKVQYTETMKDDRVQAFLEDRIQNGDRYVSHFSYNGLTTIVLEKTQKKG